MITLYTFGRRFGLPDPSPFVMKAELLLKFAEQEYVCDTTGFNKAPKGKLPYIRDTDGTVVADSCLIRDHLERTRGIDFDDGLSPPERAVARAFEKLCEDHLYWTILSARWTDLDNFNRGPRKFFDRAPAIVRPFVVSLVRRQVSRDLHSQGLGRHSRDEIAAMGCRDIAAMADYLGDKPYFMGDKCTGVDATIFPFVHGAHCPLFETPIKDEVTRHGNLVGYCERMLAEWYPDFKP